MEFFTTPINSLVLNILTVMYFIIASISTYDIRIIQRINLGEDLIKLPSWISIFHYLMWIIWIIVFLLNWYYGLILFIIKFILKVIPFLEVIGKFIVYPFDPNR